MRRWPYLLTALLYLLPQAGLVLHHEEAAAACGACEEPRGPRVECAGEDCEEAHQRGERGVWSRATQYQGYSSRKPPPAPSRPL